MSQNSENRVMNLPVVAEIRDLPSPLPTNVKFVDVRKAEDFNDGHIAGAVNIDPTLLNKVVKPVGGLLPDAAGAQAITETLGLMADEHLVIYDNGAETAAARLIWVLHAYGFYAASWLNGGIKAWQAAGLTLSTSAEVKTIATPSARLEFKQTNVFSVDEYKDLVNDDHFLPLDVRSEGEFLGTDVRSAHGGRVPRAKHCEWTSMFNVDGKLKDDSTLRQMLDDISISKDKHVVVYCQTHQRSAVTYVVLKHLGYENVSAIDGAWSAWGNRDDTPIEL
jgi:thiosulfate/3-mercaptopyruvate sulfurtransferase